MSGLVDAPPPVVAPPLASADKPDEEEPNADADGEIIAGVYVDVVRLPP